MPRSDSQFCHGDIGVLFLQTHVTEQNYCNILYLIVKQLVLLYRG